MAARALMVTALAAVLCLVDVAPPPAASQSAIEPAPGRILAPVARQIGWLSLDAPRPQLLTRFVAPSYVADLSAAPSGRAVVVSAQSFDPSGTSIGGDLLALDLESNTTTPLLERRDATESLGAPTWLPDGSRVVYQRDDLSATPTAYAGQAVARYPSRIESIRADGSERTVLVPDGHQPEVSPSGTAIVFERSSSRGTALLMRGLGEESNERELVPADQFADIAYARFSPGGDRLAFVAIGKVSNGVRSPFQGLIAPGVAYAHGLPWDVWLIETNGAVPRLLAALGADDPSLAWSPDGRQLFVYSGTGSFIVDAATGEYTSYPYLVGYGATAWVP